MLLNERGADPQHQSRRLKRCSVPTVSCVGTGLSDHRAQRHEVSRALHAALAGGHSEIHTERDGREYQLDISRIQSDGKPSPARWCWPST